MIVTSCIQSVRLLPDYPDCMFVTNMYPVCTFVFGSSRLDACHQGILCACHTYSVCMLVIRIYWTLVTCIKSVCLLSGYPASPQWGAVDAKIKVPSGENTELKRSPFKDWSRPVYSHACYAYCQEFLPRLFLPFWPIHLHFFQTLSRFLLCLLWLEHGSCVGLQNKIGHPAGCRFPCWVPAEYK